MVTFAHQSPKLKRGLLIAAFLLVGVGTAVYAWPRRALVCEPSGSTFYVPDNGPSRYSNVDATPRQMDNGWPVSTPNAEGIDPKKLAEMIQAIEAGDYTKVDSVLVARNGKLVFESYFNGYDRETKHRMMSVTKSFASALVGVAVDQKLISNLDQRISKSFPEYWPHIKNDRAKKDKITFRHLLTMTAGFETDDNVLYDFNWMTEARYRLDEVKFALEIPMIAEAGAKYSYSTPNSFLMGRIVAKATKQTIPEFAKANLFGPLGISDYCWELTHKGHALTGIRLRLRPRDMLKLGQLFLDQGVWRGQRILSKSWVKESTRWHVSTAPNRPDQTETSRNGFGYHWWTVKGKTKSGRDFELFYASGNGGQRIYVFPTWNLVLAFTSSHYDNPKGHKQTNEIMNKYILGAEFSGNSGT